jgi:GntR family transcriptional regulator
MAYTFDNSRPIYQQIIDTIHGNIIRGDWPPGTKLPSVRALAVDFGVNPNTVSRTYSELERTGVLEMKRGQGTFVTESEATIQQLKQQLMHQRIKEFMNEMESLGMSKAEIRQGIDSYRKDDDHDNL